MTAIDAAVPVFLPVVALVFVRDLAARPHEIVLQTVEDMRAQAVSMVDGTKAAVIQAI